MLLSGTREVLNLVGVEELPRGPLAFSSRPVQLVICLVLITSSGVVNKFVTTAPTLAAIAFCQGKISCLFLLDAHPLLLQGIDTKDAVATEEATCSVFFRRPRQKHTLQISDLGGL